MMDQVNAFPVPASTASMVVRSSCEKSRNSPGCECAISVISLRCSQMISQRSRSSGMLVAEPKYARRILSSTRMKQTSRIGFYSVSKDVQLAGFDRLAHRRRQAGQIQLLIRAVQANTGVHDLQGFRVDDALEAPAGHAVSNHRLTLAVSAPVHQFGPGVGQSQADSAFERLLPARQFNGLLLDVRLPRGPVARLRGPVPVGWIPGRTRGPAPG